MSGSALSDSYFLSYSRSDQEFALRLATNLRERGIAMWVDQLDIRPSEHWDRAIERAVHDCRGLVVVLSPRSVESDNVADEISFAIDHKKSVLPVMIEKCRLPLRITRMQVIDATAGYDRALEQCAEVLGGEGPLPTRNSDALPAARGISDSNVIATAKTRLTDVLGPIAGILVDREAARAGSVGELYQALSAHIESAKDRERFVGLAGEAVQQAVAAAPAVSEREPSSVPKADVDRLSALLTPFLGPISTAIARRESTTATCADDLRQRLARLIPNERERAEFLRQAGAP